MGVLFVGDRLTGVVDVCDWKDSVVVVWEFLVVD